MWFFTRHGFFSVTRVARSLKYQIRARAREHLEALCALCGGLAKIQATPRSDYPFRMFVTDDMFADVVAKLARDVTYDNFKQRVHDDGRRGGAYEKALHDVWTRMCRYQDEVHDVAEPRV